MRLLPKMEDAVRVTGLGFLFDCSLATPPPVGWPHCAQKLAAALSRPPHWAQTIDDSAPTDLPDLPESRPDERNCLVKERTSGPFGMTDGSLS